MAGVAVVAAVAEHIASAARCPVRRTVGAKLVDSVVGPAACLMRTQRGVEPCTERRNVCGVHDLSACAPASGANRCGSLRTGGMVQG